MVDSNCEDCLGDIVLEVETFVKSANTHEARKTDDGATDMVLTATTSENPSTEEQGIHKDEETAISIPKIRRRKTTNVYPIRRSPRSKTYQKVYDQLQESVLQNKGRQSTTSGILKMEEASINPNVDQ